MKIRLNRKQDMNSKTVFLQTYGWLMDERDVRFSREGAGRRGERAQGRRERAPKRVTGAHPATQRFCD